MVALARGPRTHPLVGVERHARRRGDLHDPREPIVNTPAEAYRTFSQSGMDLLVLGQHLVEK